MYGYPCEFCEGTVQARTVKREAFKHRDGFVILEDVTIGVCDNCGHRYYSANILHAVHAVAFDQRIVTPTHCLTAKAIRSNLKPSFA
jgi:YgiT-type zinc finger domain-containing protein